MIKRFSVGAFLLVMLGLGGYYFYTPDTLNVGAELPSAPALFETSLAAPITATADSFTITSNSVRGGGSLSGYNCFTIDEGSAQAEFVCGTASGTAVTNVTRGISPSDGTSAVSALQFAHRRGASVKITDFPIIQLLRNQNNGEATFENVLRYAGDVVPTGASDLADVGYVLSVVNGGSIDFDALTVAGRAGETVATGTLVYFARTDQEWYKVDINSTTTWQGRAVGITQGEGSNGAAIGGGGVLLKGRSTVNTGLSAGSLYYATTSGNISTVVGAFPIGEADSTGVLYFDPATYNSPGLGWNNTFTGSNTFSGVATFSSLVTGHASTVLRVYTATSTWTKPTGLEYVTVWVCGGGGGGGGGDNNSDTNGDARGGGGGGCSYEILDSTELAATTSVSVIVGAAGAAGSTAGGTGGTGGTSEFGNFLSATGGSGGTETSSPGSGGAGSGGDLNLAGSSGTIGDGDAFGGAGGASVLGGGGIGTSAANGGNGGNYGGGGGGAGDPSGGGTSYSGGAGAQGVVILTEYF